MINWVGLYTLTSREVGRFFSVYRQTVIPGLISSNDKNILQPIKRTFIDPVKYYEQKKRLNQ